MGAAWEQPVLQHPWPEICNLKSIPGYSCADSVHADATSWRGGGNKNNSSGSPTDQEAKALGQEDGSATPAEQNDGQKAGDKRDVRLPQVPQPKLNGQQQPPISSQYRAMMPPYVSDSSMNDFWAAEIGVFC